VASDTVDRFTMEESLIPTVEPVFEMMSGYAPFPLP
jgi:hypothetical protein